MYHTSVNIILQTLSVIVKPAKTRLCGLWPGDAPGDTPWKDVKGALLAEVKSSAYGDLDRRASPRLS